MPLSINTNLSSLAAQRALSASQDLRTAAVQRLSSGLRINAARDDAAGLAISDRLTTQIRGLAQSARNAQDAIGLSQTAEAALASISDNLQRVRELAVQAANGTNSAAERQSLDAEVRQRVAEIDRIATSASFGGIKLLDGTAGTLGLQIGMEAGQTIEVDLSSSLRSSGFGAIATLQSADLRDRFTSPGGATLGAGHLTVQVGSGPAVSVTGTFTSVEGLAAAINAAMGGKGSAAVGNAQGLGQQRVMSDRSRVEFANYNAFAALRDDGSVITWGDSGSGGNSSSVSAQLSSGVQQIFSSYSAFAALKGDGSVVTWGNSSNGGNSSAVAAQLTSRVQQVSSTQSAFAALKTNGAVVTWGNSSYGGDSSSVAAQLTGGVQQVFSNGYAFAALKSNGAVVTWGESTLGGNSAAVSAQLASGVQQVFSTGNAFAALKTDGSVVTWGDINYGGNSSAVSAQLASGVQQVFGNEYAFAALKADGSVVTWGLGSWGGDSSAVAAPLSGGVQQIFATRTAFAALKSDGSVVTWGSTNGGDSTAVSTQLSSGVQQIFSTATAFSAVKADGSVVTWGNAAQGGDSSAVSAQLSGGVQQIFSTGAGFAALKSDGSVVTWGLSTHGGNSSAVAAQLSGGVQQIFSSYGAFAALKSDGSMVTWGGAGSGGDSSAVQSQLTNVSSAASPFSTETPLAGGITLTASERIVIGGARSAMLGFTPSALAVGSVDSMGVSSIDRANETISRADRALQSIATQRARMGATLSRFDSLIGDLNTAGSNLTASRSRILDADYAAETAALTRSQIIQQAGQAMLAQANANPRLILALLRSDR